jgi:sodium/potassium/calcium exchanger 6
LSQPVANQGPRDGATPYDLGGQIDFLTTSSCSVATSSSVARSTTIYMVLSTFFPKLHPWPAISLWRHILDIITAPGTFLLTLTVPTLGRKNEINDQLPAGPALLPFIPECFCAYVSLPNSPSYYQLEREDEIITPQDHRDIPNGPVGDIWKRWLVCIQLVTGPLCLVWLIMFNLESRPSYQAFLLVSAISISSSLVCSATLVATTSTDVAPMYSVVFNFLGFCFGIAWISVIASEVVAVLKATAIILNVSDDILGLTVFAVGNSCNDLVTGIALARRGFHVMAFSACLGAPMLNTLLGIGIGGLYMNIKDKHTGTDGKVTGYGPYRFQVSRSLFLSGASLLVCLTTILVAVPLNGWSMDRRIGGVLIGLWCGSTIVSVLFEVFGTI